MLCRACSAFDIQRFAKHPTHAQSYDLRDVETASSVGCEFCSLLLEILGEQITRARKHYGSDAWVHLFMSKDYEIIRGELTTRTGCNFNKLEISLAPRTFQVTLGRQVNCLAASHDLCVAAGIESHAAKNGDILGRYFGDNPDTPLHFAAICDWLAKCKNHPKCRQTISQVAVTDGDVPLPTRCIDVTVPSLQQTEGKRGGYTTLSYRWDDSTKQIRTTLENLEQREHAIDIEALPKTLNHAIYITRRMGIRYIWIDSICIIQDGDGGTDWRNESVRMADYYQQSTCTIAATCSDGRGCLFERPPIIPGNLVRLPYKDSRGENKGFFYVYRRETPLADEYERSVLQSPLLKRGWVFQERMLSRRIIYFTNTQIYFECQTCYPINECQETVPIDLGDIGFSPYADKMLLKKGFFGQKKETVRIEDTWYSVVERFSLLQLTFPERDRVLAMAGLGTEFRRILIASSASSSSSHQDQNREYVSGLWIRDIQHGLLWQHSGRGPAISSGCDTPSWSWGSYSTPVKWQRLQAGTSILLFPLRLCNLTGYLYGVQNACKLVSVGSRESQPSAAGVLQHTTSQSTNIPLQPSYSSEFDPSNTFSILKIRAPLKSVLIGPVLTDEKKENAALWTSYELEADKESWRAVSSTNNHDFLIGWSSIERPQIQHRLSSSDQTCVHAVHMRTCTVAGNGLKFGYIGLAYDVYEVLFVQKVAELTFERLGVGRIWERSFFADANIEELYLQ